MINNDLYVHQKVLVLDCKSRLFLNKKCQSPMFNFKICWREPTIWSCHSVTSSFWRRSVLCSYLRKREYSKNRIRKKWWFHDVWWMAYSLPQLSISIIVLLNFSWSCHTLKCRKLVVKDALKLLWHFHHLRSIFHVSPSSTFSFQQRSTSQIPTCKPCGFPNALVGSFKWKKHLNQGFNIQKNLQLGSTPHPTMQSWAS